MMPTTLAYEVSRESDLILAGFAIFWAACILSGIIIVVVTHRNRR
jgi:hypothetical protein